MTIYLYVKTHKKTGLKYLGKTENKDPHKYKGSGTYWTNHCKKHGWDYTTEIIKECLNNDEVKKWGIYYSKLWNVVESNEWANIIEEACNGWSSQSAKAYAGMGAKAINQRGTNHFMGPKNPSKLMAANGTHHFFGPEINKNRVENGTHHLLSGDIQKRAQNFRVSNNQHNSQIKLSCICCGNVIDIVNFFKWHYKKCRGRLCLNDKIYNNIKHAESETGISAYFIKKALTGVKTPKIHSVYYIKTITY